jgi:hypothetical protein
MNVVVQERDCTFYALGQCLALTVNDQPHQGP